MEEEPGESTAHTPYKIPSLVHSLYQFEAPQKQALPEARIGGQVVYLGDDVRKDSGTKGGSKSPLGVRGAQASGDLGGTVCQAADVLSPERQGCWGTDPPTPVSHWLRTIPGVVNSLVF